jgi:hypothetical protein
LISCYLQHALLRSLRDERRDNLGICEMGRRCPAAAWLQQLTSLASAFQDLLRFADHGDRRAVEALERMAGFWDSALPA